MAAPSEEMFIKMCAMCVQENIDFLPPYGHNASMYLRPVIEGVNPQINICPSDEVLLAVMCLPVGNYSKAASLQPVDAVISRNYDRAAPNGTGSYKVAANYAMSLYPYTLAHKIGYAELLFLDPATKTSVDEFGTSISSVSRATHTLPRCRTASCRPLPTRASVPWQKIWG